jgi:hypothetical protein
MSIAPLMNHEASEIFQPESSVPLSGGVDTGAAFDPPGVFGFARFFRFGQRSMPHLARRCLSGSGSAARSIDQAFRLLPRMPSPLARHRDPLKSRFNQMIGIEPTSTALLRVANH